MKAISLKQPWANLIAAGMKTIETRKWNTKYRGELLIVSSQRPKMEPYGSIVAIVNVVHTRRFENTREDVEAACCAWYEGFAWELKNIRPLSPIPVSGQLGIYDINIAAKHLHEVPVSYYKERIIEDMEI